MTTKQKFSTLNKDIKITKKDKVKSVLKKSITVLTLCSVAMLWVKGYTYYTAKNNDMLNFDERVYKQNTNVEPGYYNKKPIQICISNNFSKLVKYQIAEGIEYLDKKAEGLKFEYFYGDPTIDKCDIAIYRTEFDKKTQEGEATLGSMKATKVEGTVWLEESFNSILSMKALTVHELLHVLGLAHSKNINSILFPILSTSKMSTQDIKDLNTLYPDEGMDK